VNAAKEKAVTVAPCRKDIPKNATMAMANVRLFGSGEKESVREHEETTNMTTIIG
jgi:hypothetical protein